MTVSSITDVEYWVLSHLSRGIFPCLVARANLNSLVSNLPFHE